MIQIQIENIENVIRQVSKFNLDLISQVSEIINFVGNQVVHELETKYPDLLITGQFFPINLEYQIGVARLGKELTWIQCPVSTLGFRRQRNKAPNHGKLTTITDNLSQEFRSNPPLLDTDELALEIAEKLSLQINQIVGVK